MKTEPEKGFYWFVLFFLVFRRVVERKESLIYVACFCVPWILNKNTDLWFFGSSISKKTHNKKPSFFSFFFPFSASTFIRSSSLLFLVAKKQNKNRGNNKSFDIRFRWFLFNFLFFPQVLNCVSISDCLRIYTFNSRRPRSSLSENVNGNIYKLCRHQCRDEWRHELCPSAKLFPSVRSLLLSASLLLFPRFCCYCRLFSYSYARPILNCECGGGPPVRPKGKKSKATESIDGRRDFQTTLRLAFVLYTWCKSDDSSRWPTSACVCTF